MLNSGANNFNNIICEEPKKEGKSSKLKFKESIRKYKTKTLLKGKEVPVEFTYNISYPETLGLAQLSRSSIRE